MRVLAVLAFCGMSLAAQPARAAQDKAWPIDVALGRPDAPITVIEYASLGCPHCADFAEKTLPQLKAEWLDTGKARLIYRDYPLDGRAAAAAMVSHCAGPDRYFAFLDTFYSSLKTWAMAPDFMAALHNIARLGGVGPDKVDACLKDQALMSAITARKQDALDRYEVDSTPSFIINGKKVASGFVSYDDFVKLLK
jgi:protein-disulfide isomerase